MIVNYIHHEGTQDTVPRNIDTISSKNVVYVRKNIERITKSIDDEEIEMWSYDEAELNHLSRLPSSQGQELLLYLLV